MSVEYGVVRSAKTNSPDINDMAAAAAGIGVRANTRHFDEPPLAMRHVP